MPKVHYSGVASFHKQGILMLIAPTEFELARKFVVDCKVVRERGRAKD